MWRLLVPSTGKSSISSSNIVDNVYRYHIGTRTNYNFRKPLFLNLKVIELQATAHALQIHDREVQINLCTKDQGGKITHALILFDTIITPIFYGHK